MRVHDRRHHAQGAPDGIAPHRGHRRHLARLQPRQLGRGNFGTPFEPAASYEPEQLLPRRQHRTHRGAACGNDTIVRCQHAGLRKAQSLRLDKRLGSRQAGLRHAFGRQVLTDLLRRQGATGLQVACALPVGDGFAQGGFGLGERGTAVRQFSGHRGGLEDGQHLPAPHAVAHVHPDLAQHQAVGLGSNAGLLPGRNVAVGRDADGQLRRQGLNDRHGQGRLCGRLRAAGLDTGDLHSDSRDHQ